MSLELRTARVRLQQAQEALDLGQMSECAKKARASASALREVLVELRDRSAASMPSEEIDALVVRAMSACDELRALTPVMVATQPDAVTTVLAGLVQIIDAAEATIAGFEDIVAPGEN